MDTWLRTLLDPPFAKDPPVKLNVNAKTLGLVYAILAGISAVLGLLGILALLGLSGVAAVVGVGGIVLLSVVGALISEVGTVMAALGGYRMYQLDASGKRNVIYGLALNVAGSLVAALGSLGSGLVGWIVGLAVYFVLYYLVIISRFEGEPKPA